MDRKPENLIYGVDDKPPWVTTFLLGFQHVLILQVCFIYPVLLVSAMGGTSEQAEAIVKISMIAMGFTTVIQSLKRGRIGSGYLAPCGNGSPYIPASIIAAKTGGLSLVFGMTIFSGLFEGILSQVISKLRNLFPPEVVGLVVAMVGIELIPHGITRFLGLGEALRAVSLKHFAVAFATYATMMGFSVWSKGNLRLYTILIGMGVGYVLSYEFGLLGGSELSKIAETPLVAIPALRGIGWSFDVGLVLPFVIASLCSSLKDVADLTTCQKIADKHWKRPDMRSISNGMLADAIGDVFSGLLGGLGQNTSSSNIGFSLATGAVSRRIAYAIGVIICSLAFFPKLAAVFVIMPKPVMGAILVFCANFMILSGIQIIATRMIDIRKIFVIGSSFIFGLSVYFCPGAYKNVPVALLPVFHSSLSLATILAVTLNLVFRIGISKRSMLTIQPELSSIDQVMDFLDVQGAALGARKEVINLAKSSMTEFMESLIGLQLAKSEIVMEIAFDELNLDITITYRGQPFDLTGDRLSTAAELLEDESAVYRLAAFFIRHYTDRITSQQEGDLCKVKFHFDH